MFKRQSRVDYSRLVEEEDDTIHHHELLHSHPHSVLVANHHGQCNVVPPLVQQQAQQHHNANNNNMKAPRSSFSVPDATRRFFQTKLPIAFGKDMGSTAASFSSLPPVIIADFQSGNLPEFGSNEDETQVGDQGWVIVHRRRFKGKHGIGETRHQADTDEVLDEEIDPSDQVTCSVFVKWEPDTSTHTTAITQPQPYTMTSPVYDKSSSKKAEDDERNFPDPIPETEERYNEIIQSVRTAIESNMQPTRISQGSSGSYFCRNSAGKIVGVFKPKNEEPYGQLNPKWTKWIHRHLFPCFFGRSCLIPNLGYLSEAAASLIDRRLGTMIVPYTDVIHLSSPSFHYAYLDRRSQRLPPKIGSFQCFLTNYKDATVFFRDHPLLNDYSENARNSSSVWGGCLGGGAQQAMQYDEEEQEVEEGAAEMNGGGGDETLHGEEEDSDHTHVHHYPPRSATPSPSPPRKQQQQRDGKHQFRWTPRLQNQFKREFEQLIILDYLIRNTDRGLDNWMIKYCPPSKTKKPNHHSSCSSLSADEQQQQQQPDTTTSHKHNNTSSSYTTQGHIHVAAIDNGLAFPYKHPDQWRSYPYGWMAMPDALINRPFSEATRKQFLTLLSDPLWWRDTVREMRSLFEMDDDFDEKMFQKQIAVLKGQGYNIVRTLLDPHAGPVDLVAMQRVIINQEEILIEYDERKLSNRDSQRHNTNSTTTATTTDLSDRRRLRTQRSTSFDVISTTRFSDDDEEQELDQRVVQLKNLQLKQKQQRRWQDKIKHGLDRFHMVSQQKKKKKTNKKNRYRAFDSDGDISDYSDDDDDDDSDDEDRLKRVTVVIETIQVVKSRTYFTCW